MTIQKEHWPDSDPFPPHTFRTNLRWLDTTLFCNTVYSHIKSWLAKYIFLSKMWGAYQIIQILHAWCILGDNNTLNTLFKLYHKYKWYESLNAWYTKYFYIHLKPWLNFSLTFTPHWKCFSVLLTLSQKWKHHRSLAITDRQTSYLWLR